MAREAQLRAAIDRIAAEDCDILEKLGEGPQYTAAHGVMNRRRAVLRALAQDSSCDNESRENSR
jgi:hypothetical protein